MKTSPWMRQNGRPPQDRLATPLTEPSRSLAALGIAAPVPGDAVSYGLAVSNSLKFLDREAPASACQMKTSIPTAIIFAFSIVLGATDAQAGPCPRNKSQNCLEVPATINFNSVPEISNRIVSEEKIQAGPQKDPAEDASKPYTGPMIGTNPRPGRTPTVGYYWSLE